jgi:hypothetical protein
MLVFFCGFIGSINAPYRLQGIAFHILPQYLFTFSAKVFGVFKYHKYQLVYILIHMQFIIQLHFLKFFRFADILFKYPNS